MPQGLDDKQLALRPQAPVDLLQEPPEIGNFMGREKRQGKIHRLDHSDRRRLAAVR